METKEWAYFGGPQRGCVVGEKLTGCGCFVGLCCHYRWQAEKQIPHENEGGGLNTLWAGVLCQQGVSCKQNCAQKTPKSCQWHQAERQVFTCRICLFPPPCFPHWQEREQPLYSQAPCPSRLASGFFLGILRCPPGEQKWIIIKGPHQPGEFSSNFLTHEGSGAPSVLA